MESRRAHRLLLLHPLPAVFYSSVHFGRELLDISGRQEVHLHFIALLHGEQLRDLHVSASACSPSSRFSHLFLQHFLLVFPSGAVAEEMFPRLGRHPASAAAPQAFIVVSVSKPFLVRAHWCVSRLQSVEPGCERLHTVHWDWSLASSFAFQPVAMMFTAFVGLPLTLRRCLASDSRLVLFGAQEYTRPRTVPDLRRSLIRFAWRSASSFPGMPVCPGTQSISVSIPALQKVLAL